MPSPQSILTPWSSFFSMTGSSSAALIGLTFIVITIVSGEGRPGKNPTGISTFSTPTVVHFSVALLISAVLSAPWPTLVGPAIIVAITGLGGIVYLARVTHLSTRLETYEPDLEDWIWYSGIPFVAYGAIVVGAIMLFRSPGDAPFALGGSVVMLLFIGIRNAWDVVTFLATVDADEQPPASR
jgi:hypothetical protein